MMKCPPLRDKETVLCCYCMVDITHKPGSGVAMLLGGGRSGAWSLEGGGDG